MATWRTCYFTFVKANLINEKNELFSIDEMAIDNLVTYYDHGGWKTHIKDIFSLGRH